MTIFATNKLLNNAGGWGTRGNFTYHVENGIPFARAHLSGGAFQQSAVLEPPPFRSPRDAYVAASFRFPADFEWDNPAYGQTPEHKLFILNTIHSGGVGRVLINLRNKVLPHVHAYVQGFDATGAPLNHHTDTLWPADGQWHRLEVLLERADGTGRLRMWLDARQISDVRGPTGMDAFSGAQIGAYINQGSRRDQVYDISEPIVADVRVPFLPPIIQPLPPDRPPTPPSDREALARDIDDLVRRTQDNVNDLVAIAKRLRAQGA